MLNQYINRRKAIQMLGLSAAAATIQTVDAKPTKSTEQPYFTYSLNMATIRGHNLGFVKELETAAKAGFQSVEIWMDSWQTYLANGGTVKDTQKLLADLNIKVENSIGFAEWLVDDEATRKKGLDQIKREMELLAQIGCKRIAATGKGSANDHGVNLDAAAERYRVILEMGDTTGVVPQLEMWGFMKNLATVGEVLYIAMKSAHPSAKVLLDIFHLYRGNTPFDTLHLMNPIAVDILHMNDYTANFPYQTITDADRVYPGDGIAPLTSILKVLKRTDQPLILSTEVFNKNYYSQDALLVAKTSLAKMKKITAGF